MGLDLSGGHSAMDYAEHARTYKAFIKLGTALGLSVIAILLGMFFFLL